LTKKVEPGCKDFNIMKKLDKKMGIKSWYKTKKCPYCDKLHIDKLPKEKIEEVKK